MTIYPPGSLLAGRYEIVSFPKVGGFGTVYLCVDHQEQRTVVLKTLRQTHLQNRNVRELFLQEGAIWVSLGKNPHIVQCYGVERLNEGAEVYLILEFIPADHTKEDSSLESWLPRNRPIPIALALLFSLQIVRALKYVSHTIPGFVHRDLKPDNILVSPDRIWKKSVNRIRVTDFGLATVTDELKSSDRERLIAGTPLYMAPEQWKGEYLDSRTDIYALGCIMFHMLNGYTPVVDRITDDTKKRIKALKHQHCNGQFRKWIRGIPKTTRDLVKRCLSVNIHERFNDWAELEKDISLLYKETTGQEVPVNEDESVLQQSEQIAIAWAHNDLGASYMDIGNLKLALLQFEQARSYGITYTDKKLEAAGKNHMGLAYQEMGNMLQAIACHNDALQIYKSVSDKNGEALALGNLGNAYVKLGNVELGIQHLKQKEIIHLEINDLEGASIARADTGIAYFDLGDFNNALQCFENSLTICQGLNLRNQEANILTHLGNTYTIKGDLQLAEGYYTSALKINQGIGNILGEASTLVSLGNFYFYKGDNSKAIESFQQALQISQGAEIPDVEYTTLIGIGNCFTRLGQIPRAIDYLEKALTIVQSLHVKRAEASILGNLGVAYSNVGNLERAFLYHQKQLDFAQELGDKKYEGDALGNIGKIYAQKGEINLATDYLQKALKINREIGHPFGEVTALGNLGIAYAKVGKQTEAINYFKQSLELAHKINHLHEEGNALGNIAAAYRDLRNDEKALEFFEKSLNLRRRIEDISGEATDSYNLASLLINQGREDDALPLAQRASKLFSRLGHIQYFRKTMVMLSMLHRSGAIDMMRFSAMMHAVLVQFSPLILTVVFVVNGNIQAEQVIDDVLDQLKQDGWQFGTSIHLILKGERNEEKLAKGLDESNSIVIQEILKILRFQEN